jgi:DNA-directed RNA polymerase specialized sigma24 family protein
MTLLAQSFPLRDLLADQYPQCLALARALHGRDKIACYIAARVLRDSLKARTADRVADDPDRWFRHHTIMTARRLPYRPPPSPRDPLISVGPAPSQNYPAFIAAVRALPVQQREALILRFAQQLDLRPIATAMDCSTTATQLHLDAAQSALREYTGHLLEGLLAEMSLHYATLLADNTRVRPAVRRALRRHRWRRRLRLAFSLVVIFAVTAAIWWIRKCLH